MRIDDMPRRARHSGTGAAGAAPYRRTARGLIAAGALLVPWLVYLACTLPAAAAPGWTGLDALEAAGLVTTGVLLLRADPRTPLPALATAFLLVADACLDLTTAASGAGLAAALAMAVLAELPTAALCTAIALRTATERRRRPEHTAGARGRLRPAVRLAQP